jgi:LmbE family N-acetylglucosaminyl deacetylase
MNILCIGAHPDDLEIGMGGTIVKLVEEGHNVKLVVVIIPATNQKEVRLLEAQNAAKILGADITFLDVSSEDLILDRNLIGLFDKQISEFNPDIVFTHWDKDSHQDHKVISQATMASLRKNKCSLFMYEQTIPGGITNGSFRPQLFIDIDKQIDAKLDALKQHKSQMQNLDVKGNWIRGVKGRAQYRGYQINANYAEAFEAIKILDYL